MPMQNFLFVNQNSVTVYISNFKSLTVSTGPKLLKQGVYCIVLIQCFWIIFIGKVKSKFDDHSDHESGTDTAQNSEQEDEEEEDNMYLGDTPPESPVELRPELPPYLPAIQGCRNVEEFSCLNRIEEGTYGVVYRAKDKKTGI